VASTQKEVYWAFTTNTLHLFGHKKTFYRCATRTFIRFAFGEIDTLNKKENGRRTAF
jgi:hypothetical protein